MRRIGEYQKTRGQSQRWKEVEEKVIDHLGNIAPVVLDLLPSLLFQQATLTFLNAPRKTLDHRTELLLQDVLYLNQNFCVDFRPRAERFRRQKQRSFGQRRRALTRATNVVH